MYWNAPKLFDNSIIEPSMQTFDTEINVFFYIWWTSQWVHYKVKSQGPHICICLVQLCKLLKMWLLHVINVTKTSDILLIQLQQYETLNCPPRPCDSSKGSQNWRQKAHVGWRHQIARTDSTQCFNLGLQSANQNWKKVIWRELFNQDHSFFQLK